MKYNPIGSLFKEGDITLKVVPIKYAATCEGCWYAGAPRRKRNYTSSCYVHGHACTPVNRKDKTQVIFKKVNYG